MQRTACLYYPNFGVPDELWAKEALLLWDFIATIIPRGVDLTQVAKKYPLFQELTESGALRPWAVEMQVREKAGELALNLIDTKQFEILPETDPFALNFGKLTDQFANQLDERGLVLEKRASEVVVEGRVGLLVMMILAHVLEEGTQAAPVTDAEDLGRAYVSVLHHVDGAAGLESRRVVQHDLQFLMPDLANVELGKWLRFRRKYASELIEYRRSVNLAAGEIEKSNDEDQAVEILANRLQDLQRQVEERTSIFRKLTTAVQESGIVVVADLGAIGLASPTLKGAVGGLLSSAGIIAHEFRKELHRTTFVQRLAAMSHK